MWCRLNMHLNLKNWSSNMRQYFNLLFTLKVILKSNTEIDWDYHNPKHEFEFLHNLINDRFDETMIYEICKDMSHDIIKALIVNDYIDSDNIDQITIDEIQNIFMGRLLHNFDDLPNESNIEEGDVA